MAESNKKKPHGLNNSSDVSRNSKEKDADEEKELSSLQSISANTKKHSVTPVGKKNKLSKHKKQEDVHSSSPETASDVEEFVRNYRRPPSPTSPSDYAPGDAPVIVWDDSADRLNGDGKEWNISIKDFVTNFGIIEQALKDRKDPAFSSTTPPPPPPPKSIQPCELFKSLHSVTEKKLPLPAPKPVTKPVDRKAIAAAHCIALLKTLESISSAELIKNGLGNEKKNEKTSSGTASETHRVKSNKECDNSFEDLWGDEDPAFLAKATQLSQEVESKLNSASSENKLSHGSGNEFSGVNAALNERDLSHQNETFFTIKASQHHVRHPCAASKGWTRSHPSGFRSKESHRNVVADYSGNSSGTALHNQGPRCVSNIPEEDKKKKYTFTKKFNSDSYLLPGNRQSYGLSAAANITSEEKKSSNKNIHNPPSNRVIMGESASSFESLLDNLDGDILSQPEVMSYLAKVESEAIGERKYSQEEIEKKKAAAIKRRQERQHVMKKK